jgi:PhnO protein
MIRQANAQDLKAIFDLLVYLEQTEVPKVDFEVAYMKNLADEHIFYFVKELDNQILGFISLHIQYLLHHTGKVGEVQELVVNPIYQGQGIGEELFSKVCEVAKYYDCVNLEVTCNQKRIAAHEFYQKRGMKQTHYKFVLPLEEK